MTMSFTLTLGVWSYDIYVDLLNIPAIPEVIYYIVNLNCNIFVTSQFVSESHDFNALSYNKHGLGVKQSSFSSEW